MIVSRAPFRLPIGGGGTDLPSYYKHHEGYLITAAINKYMYININQPAVFNKIKINYSKTEMVNPEEIHLIQHEIVRETLKLLNIRRPIEISSMADLSAGTGMGSSSTYTVGLLKALHTMNRRNLPLQDLAEEACKVEIDLIGKPIGKQDQYAATYGGIVELQIDRSGAVQVTPLPLHQETVYELENRLMMFSTHIERDANVILSEQSQKAATASEKKGSVSEEAALQAMHHIKAIGKQMRDALVNDQLDRIGELMHEHWVCKKRISNKMSSSQIDEWYDLAMKNGAMGGKIMGAGGGGLFVFFVKSPDRRKLRQALEKSGLKYMDFKFDFEGAKILANV
jgi:D-glycero-alpha-D-manno-heptose-7-phosphate kinase